MAKIKLTTTKTVNQKYVFRQLKQHLELAKLEAMTLHGYEYDVAYEDRECPECGWVVGHSKDNGGWMAECPLSETTRLPSLFDTIADKLDNILQQINEGVEND